LMPFFHTWDTGGPDWLLPDTPWHAGEVPRLLVPVVQEEDGGVGAGVGGGWEKGNRQPIPVRLEPCFRRRLKYRETKPSYVYNVLCIKDK
jgi:hypothetical protein